MSWLLCALTSLQVALGLCCCLELSDPAGTQKLARRPHNELPAGRASMVLSMTLAVAPGWHDAPIISVVVGRRGGFGDGVGVPPVEEGAALGIAEVVEGYGVLAVCGFEVMMQPMEAARYQAGSWRGWRCRVLRRRGWSSPCWPFLCQSTPYIYLTFRRSRSKKGR